MTRLHPNIHRNLREREAALKQQRREAEEVLLAQQQLHKKELLLNKEEEEIKELIEKAAKYHHTPALHVSKNDTGVATPTTTPKTATRNGSVTEVPEEISTAGGYSVDTFEYTPIEAPLSTSTPATARGPIDGVLRFVLY